MMEGEKEEKEGKKNNTVETSCIARFKLYIRVISYGNSENGKGHQEWSKKLLRWKVSFMLTVRYHLQRWRETTLLRKLLVIVPGWKKKKKIMGTLSLGYGENRNKFEQTDLSQKTRWDGKRWRIFFFIFLFSCLRWNKHRSKKLIFDENFLYIEIYIFPPRMKSILLQY